MMTKKGSHESGANRRHILGIVDELVSNALQAGATRINVHIENQADYCEVQVNDNGKGMNPDQARQVEALLRQPRREELEEYYGDLAGVSGYGSGLTIIGMLVDEAEVDSEPGRGTVIRVMRRRV